MANEWQLEKAENAAVAGAREVLSLLAELVAVRAEADALRAVVSEMANMGTWLTFDDDDFYGVLRRAQDALAAAGTGPTTALSFAEEQADIINRTGA